MECMKKDKKINELTEKYNKLLEDYNDCLREVLELRKARSGWYGKRFAIMIQII